MLTIIFSVLHKVHNTAAHHRSTTWTPAKKYQGLQVFFCFLEVQNRKRLPLQQKPANKLEITHNLTKAFMFSFISFQDIHSIMAHSECNHYCLLAIIRQL